MLAVQNEREWRSLCTGVLGQPALAQDERYASSALRNARREELQALLEQAFAPWSAAELAARLDAAGIANARLNSMAEVWQHPQLAARRRWTSIDSPVGPLPALWPPGAVPGEAGPDGALGAVPALGEHSDRLLAELGLTPAAIAELRAAGAV